VTSTPETRPTAAAAPAPAAGVAPDVMAPAPRSRAWLFYSILAIVLWGVFGAVSKAASNAVPSAVDLQVISTIGVVPIALLLIASPNFSKRTGSLTKGMIYGVATGVCGSVGNLAIFGSMALGGDASTVYPLSGVYPLVTVILAVLILRERLNLIQVFGMGLALVALFLFNAPQEAGPTTARSFVAPWMALALVGLVLYGVAGVTQKLATNNISTELSTVCFALAFIPVALVAMLFQPVNWHLTRVGWGLSVLTGALISTGTLTLFAAYRTGKASVVTALTALYPALTVVLAVPLFHERVDARKLFAIAMALGAGVALTYEKPSPTTT
jgi:drug/metabolite transporter (DMT)-like permease